MDDMLFIADHSTLCAARLAAGDVLGAVEQHGHELPLGDPQQERARQQEQEHRLPAGAGSRHDGLVSPDDAPPRAPLQSGDKPTHKPSPQADIHEEKAGGEAARVVSGFSRHNVAGGGDVEVHGQRIFAKRSPSESTAMCRLKPLTTFDPPL